MTSRSRFVLVSLLALLIGVAPLLIAQAGLKKGKTVQVKSQKSRGEGKNENIKSKSELNDPKALPEGPAAKGGKKTRQAWCVLTFSNYTACKIQVFGNGNYLGLVPAWGSLEAYSSEGDLTLYGRADFTDGSALEWGPSTFTMSGAPFTWNLR
jgi:hypothetical protein